MVPAAALAEVAQLAHQTPLVRELPVKVSMAVRVAMQVVQVQRRTGVPVAVAEQALLVVTPR